MFKVIKSVSVEGSFRSRLKRKEDQAFAIVGPRLSNSLLLSILLISREYLFKVKLKTYFLEKAYNMSHFELVSLYVICLCMLLFRLMFFNIVFSIFFFFCTAQWSVTVLVLFYINKLTNYSNHSCNQSFLLYLTVFSGAQKSKSFIKNNLNLEINKERKNYFGKKNNNSKTEKH